MDLLWCFQNAHLVDFGEFSKKLVTLQNEFIPDIKKDNYKATISGLWLKEKENIYYFKIMFI